MKLKKQLCVVGCTLMAASALTACGTKDEKSASVPKYTATVTATPTPTSTNAVMESDNKDSRKIADQSFSVTLKPLGKVEFTSYAPDFTKNANGDVTFEVKKEDQTIVELEGMEASNIRKDSTFHKVEAVAFKDYNSDGYDDIITICSYKKSDDTYSEARIYSGNKEGTLTLEKQLTSDTNSALAVIDIQAIYGFLGVDRKNTGNGWKEAYTDILNKDKKSDSWESYAFIYMDEDAIPELVKIGNCEATGCMIVNYYDGQAYETQLSRLSFSYIPDKNLLCNSDGLMDCYYDLVYSIQDGKMTRIGAGYYGAKDNGNVQFDKNGDPIYEYKWNNTKMSKADYQKKLNAVYDTSKAVFGYSNKTAVSADEIIEQMKGL